MVHDPRSLPYPVSAQSPTTPDRASVASQVTDGTDPSWYVAPSSTPMIVMVGAVLSMLIPVSSPVAQLPAASHTGSEVAVRPAPSAVTWVSGTTPTSPEDGSVS